MKSFFKHLFATVLGLFVFSFLMVCSVVFLVGVLMLFEKGPQIPEKAVLALDLSIPISDKPTSRSLQSVVQEGALGDSIEEAITLRTVLDSIESASNDDRIVGIYLTGQVPNAGYHSGWAALKEVRESLARFQESGKPIIAFESVFNEANYFVASLADRLYMNPFGTLEFNGLATQIMFFKNAFDKYGIDVQVTRVGKYKSAVEPYIQDK